MDDKMYFMLGEVEADIFEKDIIKKAEKSFFKVNTNGNYELAFGTNSIEKGIWKSKAIKESEEGFIPNRFGYLVLTSGSETFDALVRIEGQQLLLTISTRSEESLSTKEFTFRKDFKGDAFK